MISLITGAILGVFCIVGITYRMGYSGNELFILSTWINRVIIGLVIGFAPTQGIQDSLAKIVGRGALLGFIISGSFYIATNFYDTPGFLMGIVYGIITDYIATRYSR